MTDNLIDRLRTDFESAGFTVEAVTDLWGAEADEALARGHRVPAIRALDGAEIRGVPPVAAATLARLFVLGLPVALGRADDALPRLGVDGATRLGLLEPQGESGREVRARVDLRPYAFEDAFGAVTWWILSDLGELATGGPLRVDHVLGIGGASRTLSRLIIQDPVASALDLGTGCGIQAMHASRHAAHVVATDISQRALDVAEFNARLNGITSIEFRLGSLFEPVAGETFDHIISNPPFVITPRQQGVPEYEYRDGGMVGDALVAAVIEGIPAHLNPGGVAQLLGNWEYRDGGDAFDRLGSWLDQGAERGEALDAWIIERDQEDDARYAETWIRDGGTRSGEEFDRLSHAWLDDFEHRGVDAVGFGYVTLRRPREAATLRRLERIGTPVASGVGLGQVITDGLRRHDWSAERSDAALAVEKLTVAGDVTEERSYWPGNDDPTVIVLKQGGGLGRSLSVDTGLAALVGACDGELSLAAIIGAIAQLLEVDEGALRDDLLPRVRLLVIDGFLDPQ
jgi:methylase of polypeptide subunit release factors